MSDTTPIDGSSTALTVMAPSQEERRWAAGAHLGVMVLALLTSWAAGMAGMVGAAGLILINPLKSDFVSRHAKEAFNFNLSIFLYATVGLALAILFGLVTLGLGLVLIIPVAFFAMMGVDIAWLVCSIQAASQALEGREYRYPLTLRLWR